MNPGILYALGAYLSWGLFPLYFRALRSVSTFEVLMHRMVWSLFAVILILALLRRWQWIAAVVTAPRVLLRYAVCALLIACNWFIYIWLATHDHVVDASLGYFITPLLSVLIGRIVLGERPRPVQWVAVAVAAAGVVWLAVQAGHPPWFGLALAVSFGLYGLAKKTAPLGAIEGVTLETALLFPFATIALLWLAADGHNALATSDDATVVLLIASGPVTVLPLLWFSAGARRIPLAMLGLLQYVTPTMQLLIGVVLLGEAFGSAALIGYSLIWAALVLYACDGLRRARRVRPAP